VGPGPSADRREREEEREDHEPESRQGEQRPARARIAERDREADGGEEAVRRTEPPPGNDSQRDEEHEEDERLQILRCCVHGIRARDMRAVTDDELLEPAPGRDEAVPDSTEGTGVGDVPVPTILCVREGPGVIDLLPEHERIDRGHWKRECDAAECA